MARPRKCPFYVTDEEALELHRQGFSLRKIAERTGLSHVTVWRIIKKKNRETKSI